MVWGEIISATISGYKEKLKELLEKPKFKTNLNNINNGRYSLIHLAFIYNQYSCAFLLLDSGINPYAGVADHNLLNVYTTAENLMMIKLFLWYNPNYEDVKFHSGITALQGIKGWDCSQPRQGILASINRTKADVFQYRENAALIEKQLIIANRSDISKSQSIEACLSAIHYLMVNAELLIKALEEAIQDNHQRINEPTAYQAITQHYQAKILFSLKQAMSCYKKISILQLKPEQCGKYLNLLEKLIRYAPENEKTNYAVELANLLVSLSQMTAYQQQKQVYLAKAKDLYESDVITTAYATYDHDQKIFYLKNAAQMYQHLANASMGEAKRINVERAITFYYQIAATYLAIGKKMQPMADNYKQQAELLEGELSTPVIHHAAPLTSCYPLLQRRQVAAKVTAKATYNESFSQPQEPLLRRKSSMP